jgi:hypothetical protein
MASVLYPDHQKLIDFCRTDCSPAMQAQAIRALSDLMQERSPA